MTIWVIIWVVLMMFWLPAGCRLREPRGAAFNGLNFGVYCLIPWFCVLILGLVLFGAVSAGPVMVR